MEKTTASTRVTNMEMMFPVTVTTWVAALDTLVSTPFRNSRRYWFRLDRSRSTASQSR